MPSHTPLLATMVILALCLLFPYVLANLGYIVIGLVALIVVTRKLKLSWSLAGVQSLRDRREKPRVLVTNFRLGIPKPDDPRSYERELSCRLLTKQIDGAVELTSGDEVVITGRLGPDQIVHVTTVVVTTANSRIKAASGTSAAPVAAASAMFLVLACGALWFNRAWLAPDVLAQSIAGLKESIVGLITCVFIMIIIWFMIKKLVRRR